MAFNMYSVDNSPLRPKNALRWRHRARDFLATSELLDLVNYYHRWRLDEIDIAGKPKALGQRDYWEWDNRPFPYKYLEWVLDREKPDTVMWEKVRKCRRRCGPERRCAAVSASRER
eukprot:Unigene19585_Nuclearia_a/m.55044 Unigene19585_Nuclearia_a/g.55044  ORF Unigene19585_Nuclearia_a/g.55044 Unigene19585_Nuclearia_a/m.55044 type:complete len:116 (-) Unigene19585_Nuclearia_a:76-423(-)